MQDSLDCWLASESVRSSKKLPRVKTGRYPGVVIDMILGLTAALREEKRRRKRGKRLNLLGEEESGPQFFSPGRVTAARTWQAEKEEEEQQHRQDMESQKALVAFKKLQKEEESYRRQQRP